MTQPTPTLSKRRRVAIWTLIVLASLITLVSVLTLWLKRQLLDNQSWKKASAQLIQEPAVRDSISVYLVNQLYANTDVAGSLRERLPQNLKPLAAPLAVGLKQPAANAFKFALSRPRVQNLWITASTGAHQRLVNVLENKTGYGVSTGNGTVTLDLGELVKEVGTEIGLPGKALAKLPPDVGQITIMSSDQLSLAQKSVNLIRVLSVWLLVLVLVMYGVAVYLARGARRTTLRTIAWAFVLVGVIVLVVRKLVGNYVVDALTQPAYHDTGHRVWLIATGILGQIGFATVLYGLIGLAGVTLAGPTRPASAVRRWIAPVLNERQVVAWVTFAFGLLLLVLWGGTYALRQWWGVALIGGLLAAGLVALRQQTLAEAAAEPADAGAGASTGSTSTAAGLKQRLRTRPSEAHSPAEEIARLTELHDAGSITDQEFERAKEIALT